MHTVVTRRVAAFAAACTLTGLAGVFAAPPAMAAAPNVSISSPTGAVPLTTNVIPVRGQASMPSGGTVTGELRIDVQSLEGHGDGGISVNVNGNPVPFSWDYAAAYNGHYRVTVRAQGRDGAIDPTPSESATRSVDVIVEAKPAPPSDVKATVNSKREVTVTWKPNTEPDLVGYQVQRKHEDDQDWVPVANTTATTFLDTATTAKGGDYSYQVVAVRSSATPNQGIASDPSSVKTVTVAAPPSTTTSTTTAGGGSGGSTGSGGGSGSGGGGTSGGSTGGAAGSGGGSNSSPELASAGKVDLNGFSAILDAARAPGPGAQAKKPGEDDGGFDETLPFKQGDDAVGEDGTALGIGVEEAGSGNEARKPIAFVAASLLVTVILMHLLWLKREVDKVPLEAITE